MAAYQQHPPLGQEQLRQSPELLAQPALLQPGSRQLTGEQPDQQPQPPVLLEAQLLCRLLAQSPAQASQQAVAELLEQHPVEALLQSMALALPDLP